MLLVLSVFGLIWGYPVYKRLRGQKVEISTRSYFWRVPLALWSCIFTIQGIVFVSGSLVNFCVPGTFDERTLSYIVAPINTFLTDPVLEREYQQRQQEGLDEFFSVQNISRIEKASVIYKDGKVDYLASEKRFYDLLEIEGDKLDWRNCDKWNLARWYATDREGYCYRQKMAQLYNVAYCDEVIALAAKNAKSNEEFGKAYLEIFPLSFAGSWRDVVHTAVELNPTAAKRHGITSVMCEVEWRAQQAKQVAMKERG